MLKNILVGQSGGPTAVINSSLYGVIEEGLRNKEKIGTVYGMVHGIEGFLAGNFINLSEVADNEPIDRLKITPASFLGSCRYMLPEDLGDKVYDKLFDAFAQMNIGYVFYIGGNDSMDTVSKLSRVALLKKSDIRFIGVPKTIDNDLWGSDVTFGFQSAINVATNAIDCIHTTAASHGRVFIVEVMGHKVGWLTLYAGMAGGADIILLPEIPYDINVIVAALKERSKQGKRFSILAVAEGAISKEDAGLSKKELKEKKKNQVIYPSVAYELGAQITERTGQEVRVTVPGHTQRGGEPCPYDRVLSTRLGAAAAKLIQEKKYGYMVAVRNNEITEVPLEEVAGKLKTVDPNCSMIQEAKMIGISFGDE